MKSAARCSGKICFRKKGEDMGKSFYDCMVEERIQKAVEFEKFQLTLLQLTGLNTEQLIDRLAQGWQLTPPSRDELDAMFEGMAKLGTEEANIHPDGDEHILACPRCGSGEYLHNEDGNQNDYCGQCGQKLEWGEEDEG